MEKPNLTKEEFARCVATGEASDYLSAHADIAPVYAPGSNTPRYDVILDAEASNELFMAYSKGKVSLQDATQEELQEYVNEMAAQYGEQVCHHPIRSFLIRSALIISALVAFIVVVAVIAAHK
jgi:hypothetical protein